MTDKPSAVPGAADHSDSIHDERDRDTVTVTVYPSVAGLLTGVPATRTT
jgi:hypothetical protein